MIMNIILRGCGSGFRAEDPRIQRVRRLSNAARKQTVFQQLRRCHLILGYFSTYLGEYTTILWQPAPNRHAANGSIAFGCKLCGLYEGEVECMAGTSTGGSLSKWFVLT